MAEVFFFIAGIGALAGAIGVVWDWNPFYNVLALVVHLLCLAALFLLLRSEFLAAAQVVIYAGAVMVLYVFVVAYIGGAEPEVGTIGPSLRPLAALFVGVVLVELCIALLGSGLRGLSTEGAPYEAGFGSPQEIGTLLLTKFLLPFELASLLLLIAAVGAVVLARRRRGAEPGATADVEVYSVVDALRPAGTGTMKEAVSGLPEAPLAGEQESGTRRQVGAGEEGGW
jgi:NADH-quinone oxidoreductase subunit J